MIGREAPGRAGRRLEQLQAEAHYHRQRLELYRSRLYGGRAVSVARLEEFERTSAAAADRLDQARQELRVRPRTEG